VGRRPPLRPDHRQRLYRNAFDIDAIRGLLLEPAAPSGGGVVVLCSIDPLTQIRHDERSVYIPLEGILVVDGVFALRPELNHYWDLRIWLEVDAELSVHRGTGRDTGSEADREAIEIVHRERYLAAEDIYMNDVRPDRIADMVIDNTDFNVPILLKEPPEG
jgi:uridine kinase